MASINLIKLNRENKKPEIDYTRQGFIFSVYFSIAASIVFSVLTFSTSTTIATTKLLGISLVIHGVIYCSSILTKSHTNGVILGLSLLSIPCLYPYIGYIAIITWWTATFLIFGLAYKAIPSYKIILNEWRLLAPAFPLILSIILSQPLTSFNILSRLHAGDVHQDTLYHGALAGMLKTYGVASVGLSGLIQIKYHWFSHLIFASISNISGVDVLSTISIIPTLVFAPLLLGLMVSYGTKVLKYTQVNFHLVASIICVMLTASFVIFRQWGVYINNWYVSEGYSLSLIIFVSYLCLDDRKTKPISSMMTVIAVTLLATISKGPVGLAITLLQFGRCLADYSKLRVAFCIVSLMTFCLASSLVTDGRGVTIDVLSFPHRWFRGGHFISLDSWAIGLLVLVVGFGMHFSVPITTLVVCKRIEILQPNLVLKVDIASMILFGLSATLLLKLGGANEVYFSMLSWIMCVPILSVLITDYLHSSPSLIRVPTPVLVTGLFAMVCVREFETVSKSIKSMKLVSSRNQLVLELSDIREKSNKEVKDAEKCINYNGNPIERCTARPFLFPAISERAWTNVIEKNISPCEYYAYGYDDYKIILSKNIQNTLLPPNP